MLEQRPRVLFPPKVSLLPFCRPDEPALHLILARGARPLILCRLPYRVNHLVLGALRYLTAGHRLRRLHAQIARHPAPASARSTGSTIAAAKAALAPR